MSQEVFFTSDHHFNHANICKYANRPYDNVHDMNEDLIYRWNSVVSKGDLVYHLGDLIFTRDANREDRKILDALNGQIYLIRGNHDRHVEKFANRFVWIKDYFELKVDDRDAVKERQSIVLMHYAMRVWNKSHHGAWQLYGHSHGSLPDDPNALAFDVGVDCHDYTPISYENVKQIMKGKSFKPIDHHGQRENGH